MDLHQELLQLVAPLRIGDVIARGVRLTGVSTDAGWKLTFDVRGTDVDVDVAPVGTGKFAARSARYTFSYRVEGGRKLVDPRFALALCEAIAARARPNEEAFAAALAEQAKARTERPPRVREVHVTRLLEPASDGATRYYKLSPYVGCLIGCRYCYAQAPIETARRLELLPTTPWGSYVDVRVNAAEVLRAELGTLPPLPIKFCPIVSDPYQAVEAKYALTRACLEALRGATDAWPTMILTRSQLVTRDLDVISALPGVWVGASVPTADDSVRRDFEPRAASVSERIEALTRFRARGVKTFAVVQPMLPGNIDELADLLAPCVSHVTLDVLYGDGLALTDFEDPRYAFARQAEWQRARAAELAAALAGRGVIVFQGELPPELLIGASPRAVNLSR